MAKRKANYDEASMMDILKKQFYQCDADREMYAERYEQAWNYYQGKFPIDEMQTGVDPVQVVREVVDENYQIIKSLFNSSDNSVVRVRSNNLKAEYADAISKELNTVAFNLNDISRKLEGFIKEALLTGQSHMKVTLTDRLIDERTHDFEEWTEEKLEAFTKLLSDRGFNELDINVNEKKTRTRRTSQEERDLMSKLNKPVKKSIKLYTGSIHALAHETLPLIEYCPFQEIYIHPYTQYSLDNTPYFCHRYYMSINDGLLNEWDEDVMMDGIDLADNDPSFATTGLIIGEQFDPITTTASGVALDNNNGMFVVFEHYWKGNYKGKIPKLWKFVTTKNQFLQEPEEVDEIPFVSARVMEIPNSFYGSGLFDTCKHLQDSATREKRMLTYSALQNTFGRFWALKDAYDKESILNNRAGGIVEIDQPNAVGVFPVADVSNALNLLMRDTESAISAKLKSAAMSLEDLSKMGETSGVSMSMMINKQEQAPKSLASTFAETGLVPLYKKLYHLLQQIEHPVKAIAEGVTMRDFPKDVGLTYDLTTTEDKQQAAQNALAGINAAIQMNGGQRPNWISDENIYKATADYIQAGTGEEDVSQYVTDPKTMKPKKRDLIMQAATWAAQYESTKAAGELANLKNAEMLSTIQKNDASAAYSAAQMESIKLSDAQKAELNELMVANQILQNALLASQIEQTNEETEEAPIRLNMDITELQSGLIAQENQIANGDYVSEAY